MIRFGVHCSLKGGLAGALDEAAALGCESLQIFTRSPRMWKMRPPADDDAAAFRAIRIRLGLTPLVVHTPYLPNLATTNGDLYEKSRQSMHDDLAVMRSLSAEYLVIHPGASSEGSSPAEGMRRVSAAISDALAAQPGPTMVLLENVAGGGRRVGASLEELAVMLEAIKPSSRVGICLDSAHAFGAGFDMSDPKAIDIFIDDFDRIIGLDRLKVIHVNDSMVPLASHRDRHEHLGKGMIGLRGLRHLIQRLKDTAEAGILETPKDPPGSDGRNLKVLFGLRDG